MTGATYAVLGLARANATWFTLASRWSSASVVPVDFARCLSAEQVRNRLASGRRWSALMAGGDVQGVDRDLIAAAARAGVAVIIVDDRQGPDWYALGASAVVEPQVDPERFSEVIAEHAEPLPPSTSHTGASVVTSRAVDHPLGALVAVTGPGGTGASVSAMALAQGLAERQESVVLVDGCRGADQAMLHDIERLVPGLQEIAEAHRHGTPAPAVVRDLQGEVSGRGYRLVPGLRRARHWVMVRPDTIAATLDSIRRSAVWTVVDVDPEVEGEIETGSADIEERHAVSRVALSKADLILVVVAASTKGVHGGIRLIDELVAFGIDPARLLPVVAGAERSPRRRRAIAQAFAELTDRDSRALQGRICAPLNLPSRDVDAAVMAARPLPQPLPRLLAAAVGDHLASALPHPAPTGLQPARIVPGTLGVVSMNQDSDR